jgi:dTDP-glucose 4,6-dehydratase
MGFDWDMVQLVEDRKGHDRRYSVDDSLIRGLGYSPRRTFDQGLEETIAWYRDNEWWWRPAKSGVPR